jgi:hypothetical protein
MLSGAEPPRGQRVLDGVAGADADEPMAEVMGEVGVGIVAVKLLSMTKRA